MPNNAKNINTTSIEDLVNSSLDIAAEEVLMESSAVPENIIKTPESELTDEPILEKSSSDILDSELELEVEPDIQKEVLVEV